MPPLPRSPPRRAGEGPSAGGSARPAGRGEGRDAAERCEVAEAGGGGGGKSGGPVPSSPLPAGRGKEKPHLSAAVLSGAPGRGAAASPASSSAADSGFSAVPARPGPASPGRRRCRSPVAARAPQSLSQPRTGVSTFLGAWTALVSCQWRLEPIKNSLLASIVSTGFALSLWPSQGPWGTGPGALP